MIKRVNGKLELKSLDLMIQLGNLFEHCKTEKEIDWLLQQIVESAEVVAEEVLDELEDCEEE